MFAVSEKTSESTASALAPIDAEYAAEPAADTAINAVICGGDRIMMWLLLGFFFLLGGIVLSELVLKVILRIPL